MVLITGQEGLILERIIKMYGTSNKQAKWYNMPHFSLSQACEGSSPSRRAMKQMAHSPWCMRSCECSVSTGAAGKPDNPSTNFRFCMNPSPLDHNWNERIENPHMTGGKIPHPTL